MVLITSFSSSRAFLYVGFLSNEECDHLISLVISFPYSFNLLAHVSLCFSNSTFSVQAHGKLEKARVIDGVTGESAVTKGRISSGMFLRRDQVSMHDYSFCSFVVHFQEFELDILE